MDILKLAEKFLKLAKYENNKLAIYDFLIKELDEIEELSSKDKMKLSYDISNKIDNFIDSIPPINISIDDTFENKDHLKSCTINVGGKTKTFERFLDLRGGLLPRFKDLMSFFLGHCYDVWGLEKKFLLFYDKEIQPNISSKISKHSSDIGINSYKLFLFIRSDIYPNGWHEAISDFVREAHPLFKSNLDKVMSGEFDLEEHVGTLDQ